MPDADARSATRPASLATPLEPVGPPDSRRGLGRLRALIAELGAERVVVGLPLSLSGADSAQTAETREFAATTAGSVAVPVELYDERFTTRLAERSGGRASEDSRAAAHLLEGWLAGRQPAGSRLWLTAHRPRSARRLGWSASGAGPNARADRCPRGRPSGRGARADRGRSRRQPSGRDAEPAATPSRSAAPEPAVAARRGRARDAAAEPAAVAAVAATAPRQAQRARIGHDNGDPTLADRRARG